MHHKAGEDPPRLRHRSNGLIPAEASPAGTETSPERSDVNCSSSAINPKAAGK